MNHVIRTKDTQRELLYAYSVHMHSEDVANDWKVPARIPASSLLDGYSKDLR